MELFDNDRDRALMWGEWAESEMEELALQRL